MSNPNSKDHSMKWMGVGIVACCALPIVISIFFGGSLGFLFGRSSQQASNNQLTNKSANLPQPQPTNAEA